MEERDSHPTRTKARQLARGMGKYDGRTQAGRYMRQLIGDLETDLGGDLTAGQRELVKRTATIGAFLADLEGRYLAGEALDPTMVGIWFAASNNQRRLIETLGCLARVPKPVSDLRAYLTGTYGNAHHEAPAADGDAS